MEGQQSLDSVVGLASCCHLHRHGRRRHRRASRSRALTTFVCPVEPRTQDRQRDVDGEDGGEGASEHSSCQEHQEAASQEEAPRCTVPGGCFSGAGLVRLW